MLLNQIVKPCKYFIPFNFNEPSENKSEFPTAGLSDTLNLKPPIAKLKNPLHRPKPMVGFLSLINTTRLQTFDHLTRLAKNPLLLLCHFNSYHLLNHFIHPKNKLGPSSQVLPELINPNIQIEYFKK